MLAACKDPDESGIPFKPDAIIANPPAYGAFIWNFSFALVIIIVIVFHFDSNWRESLIWLKT